MSSCPIKPEMPMPPPLGLYIHIPWCVRKCPYCDFNSHAAESFLPEKIYINAVLADLEQDLTSISGRRIETVFIGGGTPSLFSPDSIRALLDGAAAILPLSHDAEITLEANPGTAESGKFRGYREAGINRLSMGVQSFNDRHLEALGRIHGGQEARRSVEIATGAGFDNFNLDLMFGLPGQTRENALEDMRIALALGPTHLSFYQLTLEPNTFFHRHPPALPEDDRVWEMQRACQEMLSEQGFRQYEVSAYARDGFRCRHNENYWRFGDYLGVGAGAHGKVTESSGKIRRKWKLRHPARFVETAGTPACIGGQEEIGFRELPLEFLMNHLRLREGFHAAIFETRTGLSLNALEPGLSSCLGSGLLENLDGVIRCTERGWNFLDTLLQSFVD